MNLEKTVNSIRYSVSARFIDKALSSVFFPIVTAGVTLICYYAGLDVVLMWYLALCGVVAAVCCKDVTPVLLIFLFLNVMISMEHNPSAQFGAGSDYFARPEILGLVITAGVIFIAAVLFRAVFDILSGKFKATPMFWGIVVFLTGLIFNGAFSVNYSPMSLLFGLMLAAIILLAFVFISGGIKVNEKTLIKFAYYLVALFFVVFVELIVAYCTYEGLIVDGEVQRDVLSFGWGTYNNLGLLLVIAIPAWFYLALKFRYGQFYLLGAAANVVAALMSVSRQCILMGGIVFVLCCIWLIVASKGKRRIINLCIIGGFIVAAAIVFGVMHEYFLTFFARLADSAATGSRRTIIWKDAIEEFLNQPFFGKGFFDYTAKSGFAGYAGSDIFAFVPFMCHNTVIQLLCCGGLFGTAAYAVHRIQTIVSFFKNITNGRVFVALMLVGFVLTSLLDNHMFYISTTTLYVMLAALLSESERSGA